jgi:hypothetical protein
MIGLSGKSGCGKDYTAKMMYNIWGYYPLPLALCVKLDAVSKCGISYTEAFISKPPKVRQLLQKIGTDDGRLVYGEDMWINATMAAAQWFNDNWGIYKFVLPDVRFKNEMRALQNNGHKVVRIIPDNQLREKYGLTGEASQHQSETDLDDVFNSEFDGIVYNAYGDDINLQIQIENMLTNIKWYQFFDKPETD